MTQVTLAVLIATDGRRYKLKGWRSGSHELSTPSRPAKLLMLTAEEGWKFLESWDGSDEDNNPKPDEVVLQEALQRLDIQYGVEIERVVLHLSSSNNSREEPLGWGHKSENNVDGIDFEVVRE